MKTCIITGASSGIGRATAINLSNTDDYSNIVIIGRDYDKLNETFNNMNSSKNIMKLEYDLLDIENISALVEKIYIKFNSIDCLLNIAGYTEPEPILNTSIINIINTYKINVFAPFFLTKECIKYMKDNVGISKILNVASTAGITPRPGWISYASSKSALISMSKTMSEELEEYNIKVYCVSPGRCATDLRRKLAPDEDQSKIMQPNEVSQIICNLISSSESCLDGQNIIIRKKSN